MNLSELMNSEMCDVEEVIDDVVDVLVVVVIAELKEMLNKKRAIWVRD